MINLIYLLTWAFIESIDVGHQTYLIHYVGRLDWAAFVVGEEYVAASGQRSFFLSVAHLFVLFVLFML